MIKTTRLKDEQVPENGGGGGGVSPIAKVEETPEGATITITDVNGTTTASVKNATINNVNALTISESTDIAVNQQESNADFTIKDGSITQQKLSAELDADLTHKATADALAQRVEANEVSIEELKNKAGDTIAYIITGYVLRDLLWSESGLSSGWYHPQDNRPFKFKPGVIKGKDFKCSFLPSIETWSLALNKGFVFSGIENVEMHPDGESLKQLDVSVMAKEPLLDGVTVKFMLEPITVTEVPGGQL